MTFFIFCMNISGMQSPSKSTNEFECGEDIKSVAEGVRQVESCSVVITKSENGMNSKMVESVEAPSATLICGTSSLVR